MEEGGGGLGVKVEGGNAGPRLDFVMKIIFTKDSNHNKLANIF